VVLASGSRISGKELGQGSSHAQVTDTRCKQACRDSCQFCALVPTRNRCIPQTTLALPPEVRLRDRLADNAVHDCEMSIIDSLAIDRADWITYIENRKSKTEHGSVTQNHG
jgi:wyosine [tRNA(Phe)-imidazoG37] synthetase (radical SAM superfamily)